MKSKILIVALIIIGVGTIFLLQTKDDLFDQSGLPGLKKGTPAPDFMLPDLNGKVVSLADYKGKVVLLNFWATWCLPCVEEMPSMEKLHQKLKGDDFKLLAVSIGAPEAQPVSKFMKNHRLSFTALIDTKGDVKGLYKITGVPESFIIDREGNIVEKVIGPLDWASSRIVVYFQNLIQRK